MSTETLLLSQAHLDPQDWQFIAEGNQHLLLAYANKDFPLFQSLLRFNKVKEVKAVGNLLKDFEGNLKRKVERNLTRKIKGIEKFLVRESLVDRSIIQPELLEKFVREVEDTITPLRKSSRREKKIDVNSDIELIENLQRDFSIASKANDQLLPLPPLFSALVEIKPKSPLEERYSSKQILASLSEKSDYQPLIQQLVSRIYSADEHEKCRFFKTQLSKLEESNEKFSRISLYKPIEFFRLKISQEIKHLVETPQNNFKVTLFQGKEHQVHQAIPYINDLNKAIHIIERVIRLFDRVVEDIQIPYNWFINQINAGKINAEEENGVIDQAIYEIVSEINNEGSDLNQKLQRDFSQFEDATQLEDLQKKDLFSTKIVVKFLISVAFRDLSILINFFATKNHLSSQTHHPNFSHSQMIGDDQQLSISLISRIAIIDCELKPLSTVAKYLDIETRNLRLHIQYIYKQITNDNLLMQK